MTYADAEWAAKEWLLAQSAITALVGQRVYFSAPQTDALTYPLITITRVAGGPTEPIDEPLMQFDCWSTNKHSAAAVAYVLLFSLDVLSQDGFDVSDGSRWMGASGSSLRPFYQLNDTHRRYIVQASMALRRSAA